MGNWERRSNFDPVRGRRTVYPICVVMSHTHASIYVHIVFATKGRYPFFADRQLRTEAHAYLAGTCRGLGFRPVQIGGIEEHVHLLVAQSRTVTIADAVKEIKKTSNKIIRAKGVREFAWQEGYGVFSCSQSQLSSLAAYVLNQEAHHKIETPEEEFRRLLREAGIDPDEQ